MKKKELIEIIRFAVRKELKECLPTIIKECINSTPKKSRTQPTPRADSTDPVDLVKRVLKTESRVASSTKRNRRQKSPKDLLKEALEATSGGIPQEGTRVTGEENVSSTPTDFNGQPVDVDTLPEPLASALTRDYSDLMTAIDKKKGNV